MMQYFIKDIAQIVSGNLVQYNEEVNPVAIAHLLIDSRKVIYPESSVFIAISGERNNGHHYLKDAYDAGVKNFIVEELPAHLLPDDCSVVQVNNSVQALQDLAAFHRVHHT